MALRRPMDRPFRTQSKTQTVFGHWDKWSDTAHSGYEGCKDCRGHKQGSKCADGGQFRLLRCRRPLQDCSRAHKTVETKGVANEEVNLFPHTHLFAYTPYSRVSTPYIYLIFKHMRIPMRHKPSIQIVWVNTNIRRHMRLWRGCILVPSFNLKKKTCKEG